MNFFEGELRKLFGDGQTISDPNFTGKICLGTLGKELRVRAEFVTTGVMDHYDAMKLTVLNRSGGSVDTLLLRFRDIWGRKPVPRNPNFANGVIPHIWTYNGQTEWYAWVPTQADREQLVRQVRQYLEPFRERPPQPVHSSPKLVYICAPLRGEVEKNIEFARQKAQEVFQAGDIPVCPHLMFPPVADPENPQQDQAAREMGLRLVESCQQVNVYGPEWTEGMWAEIRHAMDLGIEVKTDQQTIGHSPPRRQAPRKGKGAR